MILKFEELRLIAEHDDIVFIVNMNVVPTYRQTMREDTEMGDAFTEVVDWCYDQFGSPLLFHWSYMRYNGSITFRDRPEWAAAFKVRWG